jgi:hypothetical protein
VQQTCSNLGKCPETLRKATLDQMRRFAGNLQYREMPGNLFKESIRLPTKPNHIVIFPYLLLKGEGIEVDRDSFLARAVTSPKDAHQCIGLWDESSGRSGTAR